MIDETAMIPCQCISQREFAIGNKARTFREGLGIRPFILPHPPPPPPSFYSPGAHAVQRFCFEGDSHSLGLPSRTVILYNHNSLYLLFSVELWNLPDFLVKLYTEVKEFR